MVFLKRELVRSYSLSFLCRVYFTSAKWLFTRAFCSSWCWRFGTFKVGFLSLEGKSDLFCYLP